MSMTKAGEARGVELTCSDLVGRWLTLMGMMQRTAPPAVRDDREDDEHSQEGFGC